MFELGAEANVLDPIWQVMPDHQADLPWTVHGDIACPLLSTERTLAAGDVLWVDTGIMYRGFHSDFGRTWVVGQEPTARQQAQYARWRGDQRRGPRRSCGPASPPPTSPRPPWRCAAATGRGWRTSTSVTGSASTAPRRPTSGTDLGDAYDRRLVLAAGTVLVIEPVVWDEGHSGYRSENVYVITEDGCVNLTDYPYDPYGD